MVRREAIEHGWSRKLLEHHIATRLHELEGRGEAVTVLFGDNTQGSSAALSIWLRLLAHRLPTLIDGLPSEMVAGLACPAGPVADIARERGVDVHLSCEYYYVLINLHFGVLLVIWG